MRKWMTERFKRKKAAEKAPTEAAHAPLQPKYFDAENSASSAPEVSEPGSSSAPEPVEAQESPKASSTSDAPARTSSRGNASASAENLRRGRRRRRGRGGRGREGAPAAAAVAEKTPAVVAALVPAAPRVSKGSVVLAIGLPGSGKSAWFKRNNITPLSTDLLRVLLFDDATEQRFQDLVFSNLRSMLKARLIARRPINYVDATNLAPQERQGWIKLAHDYGYDVDAVFFDVPAEVCLERNRRRERVVPDDVMHRMAAKLKPPTFEEGFAKIKVVKVKKKEGEEAS